MSKESTCMVVRSYPTNAIKEKDFFRAIKIDEENCANCGRCVNMYVNGAFQFTTSK